MCDFEVIGQVEVICLSLFEVIQKRLSNKTVKKDFSNKDRQLSVFVKKDFQTKDRQLESLWKEAKIGGVLPWEGIADEAERLLAISRVSRNVANEGHDDGEQENDQEVERNETDPYNEVIFGRRRPESVMVDWTNKVLFVLKFKRTTDQRRDYRERGESRAITQWPNTTFSFKVSKK